MTTDIDLDVTYIGALESWIKGLLNYPCLEVLCTNAHATVQIEAERMASCNNFTIFCCMRPTCPYLSAILKPDNLDRICNNDSEKALRQAGEHH